MEMTRGRGADVVLHMANTPASFIEGIEMLKRGGMMLEMGNFADTGDINMNIHRHICSKNIRLIGLTNHPSTGYARHGSTRAVRRSIPLRRLRQSRVPLADVDEAMRMAMDTESLKVVINPNL